jgi:hypothetical protein
MSIFKRNQYKTVKAQPSKLAKKRTQLHSQVQNTVGTLSGQHTTTLLFQAVQCPSDESLEEWIAVHMIQFYNTCNDHFATLANNDTCTEDSCPSMSAGLEFMYLWRDSDSDLYNKPTSVSAPKYASLALKWCENLLNNEKVFPPQNGDSNVSFPKDYIKSYVKEMCKKLFRIYAHIYVDHDMINKKGNPMDFGFKHFLCFALTYALLTEKELEPLKNWIVNELGITDLHRFLKEQKRDMKELLKAGHTPAAIEKVLSNSKDKPSSSKERMRRQSRISLLPKGQDAFNDNLSTLSVKIVEAHNLTAKDIYGSSDPYVTIRVGNEEMRTTTIWKQLNPVWEESFTFVIGPEIKLEESLIVFKVFDQNRIMKGSFIGQTEQKMSLLLDERMHEMWLPLHGEIETTDPEAPSRGNLHVRLQYVSSESGKRKYLTKLVQLPYYAKLMHHLHRITPRQFIALFDLNFLSNMDQCWKSLLLSAQAKDQRFLYDILYTVIELEVARCSSKGVLFRSNNIASKFVSHAVRMYGGLKYLHRVLTPCLQKICAYNVLLEVNPARVKPEDNVNIAENMEKVLEFAQDVVDSVVRHEHLLPNIITALNYHLRKHTELKFPEEENVGFIATSGLLFLRFICPALASPQLYGLPSTGSNNNAQRNLLMISKIIQNLANNVFFGDKESFMIPANTFIASNLPKLNFFFDSIFAEPTKVLVTEPVEEDKLLLALFNIHELYYKSIDVFEQKLASENCNDALVSCMYYNGVIEPAEAIKAINGLYKIVRELGAPPQVTSSARKKIKASFNATGNEQ